MFSTDSKKLKMVRESIYIPLAIILEKRAIPNISKNNKKVHGWMLRLHDRMSLSDTTNLSDIASYILSTEKSQSVTC